MIKLHPTGYAKQIPIISNYPSPVFSGHNYFWSWWKPINLKKNKDG